MSELCCPKCGDKSVGSEGENMAEVWTYHAHYSVIICKHCGCVFKVLRQSEIDSAKKEEIKKMTTLKQQLQEKEIGKLIYVKDSPESGCFIADPAPLNIIIKTVRKWLIQKRQEMFLEGHQWVIDELLADLETQK